MAYYKTEKEELNAFSTYYESMLDVMDKLNLQVKDVVGKEAYSQIDLDALSTSISAYQHYLNGFYYGYLGSLSLFPKSARKVHFDMAKKWTSFPNGSPLDLTQEEYEQFQMQEYAVCDEEMRRFEKAANYEEQRLDQMEEKMIDLERKAEKF